MIGSRHPVHPGDVYGRWTVLGVIPGTHKAKRRAHARCSCGAVKVVQVAHLREGRSASCGCWSIERETVHGYAARGGRSPEYIAWVNIKGRCLNPKHPNWRDYGGRGIRMCQEWQDGFEAFLAHVGPRPSPKLTIDRIDNDGHYEPGNVRWTDRRTQRLNQRSRERLHGDREALT